MKHPTRSFLATALAVLVALSMVAIVVPAGAQASEATEIDSCTEITEPGEYVLTTDIENSDAATCIRVVDGVEGVTIDGEGHTIDGVDREGANAIYAGEYAGDTSDVTVEDLSLTDWEAGVHYFYVDGGSVRDLTVESSERGIVMETSFDVDVRNNVLADNDDGVFLFESPGIELAENVLAENDEGIVALGGSATITDTAASNGIDYRSLAQGEIGSPRNTVENFTLDSARISFEDAIDYADFFGAGERLELSAVESPPAGPDGLSNVGGYVEANADETTTGSFALSIHYEEADVPEGIEERSLQLYAHENGEWTEVSSSVDTEANTVSATFEDPAVFADGVVLAPFGGADGDGAEDAEDSEDTGDDETDAGDDPDPTEDDRDDGDAEDDAGNDGDTDGDAGDGEDTAGGEKSNEKKNGEDADGKDDVGDGDAGDGADEEDVVDVGRKDLAIDLGEIVIADFDLRGPGIADEQIDHRTYEVGGFDVEIEGLSLAIGDTDYRFGHLTIVVEPFDIVLENVTLGDGA